MLISEILNKEYRLCDFEEREKSVLYKEIDLDELILGDAKIDKDNLIEIVDADISGKLI
ncbi:hypothetical protein [Peptostreptococcus faecalis]|uniref:hypothetical protein n=1 Tax=Peptostreptococcus faecalis TaxID=2045015 RepID=UPI0015E0AA4D|nr:hypothetical protein [Peptostreptococcus faecalis]